MIKTAGFIVTDMDGLAWGKGRTEQQAWESAHATIEALASLQGQYRSRIIPQHRPVGLRCNPATRGLLTLLDAATTHLVIEYEGNTAMTQHERGALARRLEREEAASVLRRDDGVVEHPGADPTLPALCVAVLPDTWRPVLIRRGEAGTWKWGSGAERGRAFNAQHGITDTQVAAMIAGLTKGWNHPDAWPSRATGEAQEG